MVLQLTSSPLVARSASTTTDHSTSSLPPSTSNNTNTGSTTTSSILQLSFLSDMSKGKYHHRQRNRQRTTSATRSLHSAFHTQTQKDQHKSSSPATHLRTTLIRTIVRLTGFCSALYPILIVPTLRKKGLKDGFGGGTQYLTIVGLLVTMVCIGLSIAGDVFKRPGLIAVKNRILTMLVPVECVIGGLYWYLVFTNVYHIYPDGHKYLPFHIDIQMHGIPFLTGLIEMFFFSETLRIHRVKDICSFLLFAVFYSSWSSFCAHMDGEWPYPVLQNKESDWERCMMMVNATVIGLVIHFALSEVHLRCNTKASQ